MNLTDDDKKWMLENVLEPFRAELRELATKLRSETRDMETNLQTEFHKWASPTDARLRTHTAMLRAIDLEMEAMSDRIKKIEGPGPS